jgi:lysyl-tRNA synthetase class II
MEKSEEALIDARRAKAEHLRRRAEPLRERRRRRGPTPRSASSGSFRDARLAGDRGPLRRRKVASLGAGRRYHVFGRVVARRGFGKASFLRLRDSSGESSSSQNRT